MSLRMATMADMMIIIILFVSCPLIFFIVRVLNKRSSSKHLRLPPGPYPWPIVGNMFSLNNNLNVCLAEMAQVYGPLMSLRMGQRTLIIGSSSNVASEILKTHDDVLSGRDVTRFLQGKEPNALNKNLSFTAECDDGWRLLRNIYRSEIFSSKALESRANIRERKIMKMMEYLGSKKGEEIVIKDVVFATMINILGNASLSIDLIDYEGNGIGSGIKDSIKRLSLLAKPLLGDMFPILRQWDVPGWYKQVMHIIERELGDIWEDSLQKKRNGSNIFTDQKDFSDVLIQKGFTNQQINPLMLELFAAGTETTSLTVEWFIAELLKNQEAMQKAKDEVTKHTDGNVVKESDLINFPFFEACFKETLRLHPPGLLPHIAIETCEVMGYTIPKDSQIFVNVWAINRDPNIWDDPLSFKPERFMGLNLSYNGKDFEFLPFGSGRRMCPGQAMASKMVLLTVASLILNFDVFLPNNMNLDDLNMDEEFVTPMHKKEPLLVTLKTREYVKN